jgi:hypothetical protein
MPDTAPFAQLTDTVRTQASALLSRARSDASDQVAQLSGRAASWADQAGIAVAAVSEEAAAAAGEASRGAADTAARTAERYATLASDRVTRVAGRVTHGIGELFLRAGEALTDPRRSRD